MIFCIVPLLMISCLSTNKYVDPQPDFETILAREIRIKAENEHVIDINDLTSFKWDIMYIFGPYTTFESLQEILKLNEYEYLKTGISGSDSIHLLVFLYEGKVVKYLDFSRDKGNFFSENNIKKNDAVFKIEVDKNSPLPYYLERVDRNSDQ